MRTVFKLLILAAFLTPAALSWGQSEGQSQSQGQDVLTATDYMYRAQEAYLNSDLNTAVADYLMAIKLDPQKWEAYQDLGGCYIKLGEKDKAKAAYQHCLTLNPKNETLTTYVNKNGIAASSAPPMTAPFKPVGQLSLTAMGDGWNSDYAQPFNGYEVFFPVFLAYQISPNLNLYGQTEYGQGGYTDSVSGTETQTLTNFSDSVAGLKFNFNSFGLPSLFNLAVNIPMGDPTWETKEYASNIPSEFVNTRYEGRGFGMSAIYGLSFPDGKDQFGVAAGYLYSGAFNPSYGLNYSSGYNLKLGDAAFLALNHVQKDSQDLNEIARISVYYSFPTVSDGQNIFELGTNFSASYTWSNPKAFSLELGGQAFLPSQRLDPSNNFGVEPYNSYAPRFYATSSYAFGDFAVSAQVKYIFPNDDPASDPFYGLYYDGGGWLAGIGPSCLLKFDSDSALKISASFDDVYAFGLGVDNQGTRADVNFNLWTVSTTYELKL